MIQIKKTILTLVALFAISTGAWAEESETITTATKGTTVYTGTHFKITASYICDADGIYLFSNNNHGTATIESLNGENITKIEMHMTYGGRKATKTTTTAGQLVATDSSESANDISVINVNATSVEIGTTVEALDGTVVQIDKFVIYYGAASSGTTGPEVAWDKATKTGTFTMPSGNVTLEPEYYPQATLTAAPTAINDVPATTDGAIVEPGTVANIGSTTTAQGTVMYYVSTTALDDAALLALAADQWKADVPTAESLAQGQAYVYYYVRGNDSDTDETTFSDGDILSANALTVTLAAAPTYAVTFADDLAEPTLWTASPNAGVTKGQTVTVTYTGTKKILGVKAEKKAAAEGHALPLAKFGEIVCSDGKAYAAADKDNLPKGVKAEALVCYVNGEHGLALAMADVKNAKMSWDNDRGANDGKTAAEWCDGWNTSHPIAGATWLLASQTQWNNMISAAGSASNLSNAFSAVGGTNLQAWSYWSSTPNHGGSAAYMYYFPSSSWQWTYLNQDYTGNYIRACLEW